jgi:hypothetical protein
LIRTPIRGELSRRNIKIVKIHVIPEEAKEDAGITQRRERRQ